MDYCYSYFYNSSTNFEPKTLACEAGFIDEAGSAVPLPDELTKMFKPLECELCGVVVTSEVTAYTHYEGKVHMKNVNAFMKEQYNIYGSMKKIKVEFTPHQCEVCKCDLSSLIQAQQHYTGKIHKKNLRKINYDPQTAMALPPDINSDDIGPDLLKDLPPPPPPPVLSDFICEICNITTNTEYQLIVHKNGNKHKRKVKKLKESLGDFGTDGFGYYTGDMPVENYIEGQACNSLEPIVTDYLPLSDEPLQFNNINNIYNTQNNVNLTQSMPINSIDEENDSIAPLCIKWFNDKKEAPPTRPLEDAWVETFNKNPEGTQIHTHATKIPPILNNSTIPSQGNDNYSIFPPTSTIENIGIHEVPPEVANLPQFSVAAVLPRLQAPPSPPIGLITSSMFDTSDDMASSEKLENSCLDPPRIHFRDPKIQANKESNKSSMDQPNENESGKEQQETSDLNTDPSTSSNASKISAGSKSISFEITSNQSNLIINEKTSKLVINSEVKTNNEENKGQFISSNWESPQDKNIEDENNLKKKKGLHILFGFKKEIGKKTTKETCKDPINDLQETSVPKESSKEMDIKDSIAPNKDIRNEKTETSYEKINLIKEYSGKEKQTSDLKEEARKKYSDYKTEESKYSKEKSHSKYRKDKYDKDSNEYYKDSYDYRKDSHGYHKDSRDCHKDSRDYHKDSKDHHRSKDSHKRHREHRKHRDDYDRYSESDDSDDYRHERKKHRHSSRKEKESHRSKKPSIAQPFVHKTSSSKHSILDYLAPPSECDSNDIAMYRTPSGSYYCAMCDYKSKNSFEFTNHLFGRDHKEKKKNKTK